MLQKLYTVVHYTLFLFFSVGEVIKTKLNVDVLEIKTTTCILAEILLLAEDHPPHQFNPASSP